MLTIVRPHRAHSAYGIAAREFARLYEESTGRPAAFAGDGDVPGTGDLVVIGSDSVNRFAAERVLDGRLDFAPLVYGGDGYTIKSAAEDGRRVLYLASRRGREAR